MYLISLYFDEESQSRIQSYINAVSKKSGNTFMISHHVPPHMTVLSFKCDHDEEAKKLLDECVKTITSDYIHFVSMGVFLPYVIYIIPVLNQYLFDISSLLYNKYKKSDSIILNEQYQPYQWLPHTTIGKTLNQQEMNDAFKALQSTFVPFKAKVTRIALSKTNPYEDLISYDISGSHHL